MQTELADSVVLSSQTIRAVMPHRHNMALLDRVESYSIRTKTMMGAKNIARNEAVLHGHYPEDPIYPGSLIVEALAQASGCLMNFIWLLERGLDARRIADPDYAPEIPGTPLSVLAESKVTQTGCAYPGDTLLLQTRLVLSRSKISVFEVNAKVGDREIAHGQMTLAYPTYAQAEKW